MREPIEVLIDLINSDDKLYYDREWIEKVYDQKEFEFTISTKGSINNPKQETSYIKKLEDLTDEEIKFLLGNYINKFNNRPKQVNNVL